VTNDELAATLTALVDRAAILNGTKWRGDWINTATYAARDLVGYAGRTFMSLVSSNTNTIPSSTPTRWADITVYASLASTSVATDPTSISGNGTASSPLAVVPSYIRGLVPTGTAGTALQRAQSLVDTTLTEVLGTEFDNAAWHSASLGGTGTATMSTTVRGGAIFLDSSATGGSYAIIRPTGSGANSTCYIPNPQTDKWYCRGQFQVTTAIDNIANVGIYNCAATGAGGNGPLTLIGVDGTISTGFFSFSTTNNVGVVLASGISTVPFDNNWHTYEGWSNGTTMSFAIDGTTFASTAATNIGTNPQTLAAVASNS